MPQASQHEALVQRKAHGSKSLFRLLSHSATSPDTFDPLFSRLVFQSGRSASKHVPKHSDHPPVQISLYAAAADFFSNLFPFLTLALFTGSDPPKVDRIPQSASGTDQPEFIIFLGIFQIFRNRFGCDSFPMTIRNGDLNRILMPDPIQYQTEVLDVSCILIRITIQILIKDRYIFRRNNGSTSGNVTG